jgi:hypothetical protein
MIARILVAGLMAGTAPALAMPHFVPKPSEVYGGYVALEMPRTAVPVGALWVQDYGPSGEGAAADNLVTERSLSQVTISSELQLGLTTGILNFFGLDPSYRNRLSARFGDLSIVRVKEMSKLSGPDSELRIYEAVRAGTITITTDNDVGLKLETRALGQNLPVVGRSENGSRRNFSIDGRDMFIAFRVARQEEVRGKAEEVKLKKNNGGWAGAIDGREFVIQTASCSGVIVAAQPSAVPAAKAQAPVGIDLPDMMDPTAPRPTPKPAEASPQTNPEPNPSTYLLRVPVADGKGGLFEKAAVAPTGKKSDVNAKLAFCAITAASTKASVALIGSRLQPFQNPKAPRW